MRPLTDTAEIAKRHGMDLWKQEPALTSMFRSPLGIVLPNGELPAFNDSEEVRLYANASLYELAYENTHDPMLLAVLTMLLEPAKNHCSSASPRYPRPRALYLRMLFFPSQATRSCERKTMT